eukprot:6408812-Amphidinium_carterae.1
MSMKARQFNVCVNTPTLMHVVSEHLLFCALLSAKNGPRAKVHEVAIQAAGIVGETDIDSIESTHGSTITLPQFETVPQKNYTVPIVAALILSTWSSNKVQSCSQEALTGTQRISPKPEIPQ